MKVTGSVSSLLPLDRIEILVNGNIAKTILGSKQANEVPTTKPHLTDIQETITIDGSGWIAVRCFDARPDRRIRFAHTAPVFVDVIGQPQAPYKDEVDHFVERIEREIERHRAVLSKDAVEEYQEARAIYHERQSKAIERPVSANQK